MAWEGIVQLQVTNSSGCARRPGWFCPTPAAELPCPPGAWCTGGAVAPTTCEYPVLMAEQPDITVPDEPLTIVQRVYAKGEPLGGNICPPVRARPHEASDHARELAMPASLRHRAVF